MFNGNNGSVKLISKTFTMVFKEKTVKSGGCVNRSSLSSFFRPRELRPNFQQSGQVNRNHLRVLKALICMRTISTRKKFSVIEHKFEALLANLGVVIADPSIFNDDDPMIFSRVKINLSLFLIDQSKHNYSGYFGNSIQSYYTIEKKDDYDIIVTKTNAVVQRLDFCCATAGCRLHR